MYHPNIDGKIPDFDPFFFCPQSILSYLQDPSKRLGESGYYVAMFEAGVQHIQSMHVDDDDS
jgi:hypothetical protein